MRGNNGFTLAEVLITLVIIGVIGALTVPALIQNTQKQEYVSALKKTYSTLSQAAQMIITEEGSPKSSCKTCNDGWAHSNESVYNMFKKYLNNAKECGVETGCFLQHKNGYYKGLNGAVYGFNFDSSSGFRSLILSDGVQLSFYHRSADCSDAPYEHGVKNSCATVYADINGVKGPNIIGRDVFLFDLKESGIFPSGCDIAGYCVNNNGSYSNGRGCACKVLAEGAMNY